MTEVHQIKILRLFLPPSIKSYFSLDANHNSKNLIIIIFFRIEEAKIWAFRLYNTGWGVSCLPGKYIHISIQDILALITKKDHLFEREKMWVSQRNHSFYHYFKIAYILYWKGYAFCKLYKTINRWIAEFFSLLR